MDIHQCRAGIETMVAELGKHRRAIKEKGRARAKAIRQYYMRRAIAESILKNSPTYELAGKTYKAPPVTIMKDIAKGLCADEAEAREIAESDYTACKQNLESLRAELSAYQSMFRELE